MSYLHQKFKKTLLGVVIYTLLLPVAHAESCQVVLVTGEIELDKIATELQSISSKKTYQESVQNRYQIIDTLLYSSKSCDTNTLKQTEKFNTLRNSLALLQASAQTSAFTGFNNWVATKERDMQLCKQVIQFNHSQTANH